MRRWTCAGSARHSLAATSIHGTTGMPMADAMRLKMRLVHADRRRRHAGAGVDEAGRLAQRLDHAVLAERAVESDEHDRRGRSRSTLRARAAPAASGPSAPRLAGSS